MSCRPYPRENLKGGGTLLPRAGFASDQCVTLLNTKPPCHKPVFSSINLLSPGSFFSSERLLQHGFREKVCAILCRSNQGLCGGRGGGGGGDYRFECISSPTKLPP